MQFPATLVQLAEKPYQAAKQGQILRLDLSISCNFQQLWFSWQKTTPLPHFCTFVRYQAHVIHVEQSWSLYYKSTLRFPLSEFLLQVTNFVNFSKYSHIEVQDTGSWCRWKACRQPYHNTH